MSAALAYALLPYSRYTRSGRPNAPAHRTANDNCHLHLIAGTTDAGSNATTTYLDGYGGPGKGELLKIVQPLGVTTEMYRNIWGEMEQLRQHGTSGGFSVDQSRYYYYNTKRQVCRYSEKEGGDTLYAYDLAGYMTSYQKGVGEGSACTAPAGADKVTLGYDDLGRLKTTNFTDTATPDIANTYDDNGNLLTTNRGSSAGAVNWTYTYGNANNLETEILSVDGREYALSYTYNPDGSMASRTLPSGIPGVPGRILTLGNDGLGRQTSVTGGGVNYVSGVSYHPSGAISGMAYGNGQIFSQTLTPRLQPLHLLSQMGVHKPLDQTYIYDARGKITDIIKGGLISGDSRTYGYDALGRLTSATGLWGSTGSMTYDALGNVRTKTIGGHILTMFYDDDNRLTRYTHIGNGPDKDLAYDDRGNVEQLGGLFFTYDKSNQPININGTAAGTYRYDGHKRRVKSVIDGKTIYNIYDAAGTLVQVDELPDTATGTAGKTTDYISKIARVAKSGGAETITYLHHDHLGSVSAGTTDIGLVSWREQYAPFGFALNQHAVGKNQAGFTGHIHDGATGLLYMQARYYDPYIGRFLSVDPVGFTPERPEMFGRYTYVGNDPVNQTDSTGMAEDGFLKKFFDFGADKAAAQASSSLAEAATARGTDRINPTRAQGVVNDATTATAIGGAEGLANGAANLADQALNEIPSSLANGDMTGAAIGAATIAIPARAPGESQVIKGFTKHGLNKIINAGFKPAAVLDAVKNPLKIGAVNTDKLGRQSQRFVGGTAEIVVNPQTGMVVSANPTSTKKAARLRRQNE